ncbi:hypothetical protein ACTD5D_31415 [Nocardia takedensis]|uniref:hypothetical protein n=1 Tax=Nocardia takedensis TaxID=259390 RepID=UPI003F75F338
MHREHEDHMRGEYEQYHRLEQDMYQAETDAEIDRISAQCEKIARRWQDGPHAEHWAFLGDALEDWRRAPKVMHRVMDDIAHERATTGTSKFTDVQVRSQEQAQALTGNDRPRPTRPQRGR